VGACYKVEEWMNFLLFFLFVILYFSGWGLRLWLVVVAVAMAVAVAVDGGSRGCW